MQKARWNTNFYLSLQPNLSQKTNYQTAMNIYYFHCQNEI